MKTLLNFFKSHLALAREVAKLKRDIEHKNRVIGGHEGGYTRLKNELIAQCAECKKQKYSIAEEL